MRKKMVRRFDNMDTGGMKETPNGKYVLYEDIEKYIPEIPVKRNIIYTTKRCPSCGELIRIYHESFSDHKVGCQTRWGRRGWRQLGEYDG